MYYTEGINHNREAPTNAAKKLMLNTKKSFNNTFKTPQFLEAKIASAKKGIESVAKKAKANPIHIAQFQESFKSHMQELAELEENMPNLKRYTVTKVTVEKLILILEETPRV